MFACVWMMGNMGGRVSFGLLPGWMDTLHKSMLPASRLLHVLSLTYLMVHSPLWPMLTRWSSNSVLTRLGRNSLPVFVLGSLLSMVGYITLVHTGASFAVDLALTVGGVVLMAAMANAIEAGMFQKLRVAIASQLRTFALAMVTALERHKTRTEV